MIGGEAEEWLFVDIFIYRTIDEPLDSIRVFHPKIIQPLALQWIRFLGHLRAITTAIWLSQVST